VNVPGVLANALPHGPNEGNQVVICFALDFPHAVEIAGRQPDLGHGLGWDAATARPRLADRNFDRQPLLDLGLIGPDRTHFRAGVPLDHPVAPALGFRLRGLVRGNRSRFPKVYESLLNPAGERTIHARKRICGRSQASSARTRLEIELTRREPIEHFGGWFPGCHDRERTCQTDSVTNRQHRSQVD
jgi:hypothetical protein